jgi:molecular chaperone DnaK
MKEMDDKLAQTDKDKIQVEIDTVKKAMEGDDIENIKSATEKLAQVSYEVFGKIYQQQAQTGSSPGQQASGEGGKASGEDVVDADYEVVDDDE